MSAPTPDRVLTVPNALSVLRLALVPVFCYLMVVTHAYGWATAVLMFSGFSDWADGKIARLMDQYSRLGALLDPAVDRIYMVVVPVVFALAGVIGWPVIAVLLGRDLLMAAMLPVLRADRAAGDLSGQGRHLLADVGVPADPAGAGRRDLGPGRRRDRVGLSDLGPVDVPVVVRGLPGAVPAGVADAPGGLRWTTATPGSAASRPAPG